jgi:chromate reductase
MERSVKILGIAGSLRKDSFNRSLLRAATDLVPEGCELETFDIRDLPFYDQDHDANPDPHVVAFKSASGLPMRSCSRLPSTTTRCRAS